MGLKGPKCGIFRNIIKELGKKNNFNFNLYIGDATNEVINVIDLRARITSEPSVVLYWWAEIDLSTLLKKALLPLSKTNINEVTKAKLSSRKQISFEYCRLKQAGHTRFNETKLVLNRMETSNLCYLRLICTLQTFLTMSF